MIIVKEFFKKTSFKPVLKSSSKCNLAQRKLTLHLKYHVVFKGLNIINYLLYKREGM